jgi:hypothetical protein
MMAFLRAFVVTAITSIAITAATVALIVWLA